MSDISYEQALEHFGVKGMKWGVHQERQLQQQVRLATGTATRRDKFAQAMMTGGYHVYVAKKGGFDSVAHMRMTAMQQQKDRMNRGEATVRDKLNRQLNTPIIDLIRNR